MKLVLLAAAACLAHASPAAAQNDEVVSPKLLNEAEVAARSAAVHPASVAIGALRRIGHEGRIGDDEIDRAGNAREPRCSDGFDHAPGVQ